MVNGEIQGVIFCQETIYIYNNKINILVGGFKHFLFSIIYGIILPIDELIFFKMVKTTNQIYTISRKLLVDVADRCYNPYRNNHHK